MIADKRYIENTSCSECGSSDALGVYERVDGSMHGTCFSCGHKTEDPYGTEDEEGFGDESNSAPVVKKKKQVKEGNTYYQKDSSINNLITRGITADTCSRFGVTSILNDKKVDIAHFYPIRDHKGEIHYCVRDVENKGFKWLSSSKPMKFFGQELAGDNGKMLIVTEGACLPIDTEVLTKEGWVALGDYSGQDVLQVDSELKGEFITPIQIIDKLFTGDLIERTSNGFVERTTSDHNLARLNLKGELVKQRADILKNSHYTVPRALKSFDTEVKGVDSFLVKLLVAFQADGSHRANGAKDFGFVKEYKISRLIEILEEGGIPYIKYAPNSSGVTVFRLYGRDAIKIPQWVWSKSFGAELMLSLFSKDNLETFVREQKWWDGNVVKGRDQDEYNNTDLPTVESVQLAAHLLGYCSTIRSRVGDKLKRVTPRLDGSYSEYKRHYQVSILYSKSTSSVQLTKLNQPKVIPVVDERVMCLTVPSGYLLTRYRGCVSITGNCDAMAAHQMLSKEGKAYRVISIINGASAAVTDFKNNYEWVNSFETILLAFDQDDPGQKAAKAVAELFPLGKVKTLVFSEKDANDMLVTGKSKEFLSAVYNSKKIKVEGVVGVDDLLEEAMKPVEWGLSYPFPTLTKVMYGLRFKELIGIGAGSGSGKSQLVKEIVFHIMEHHKMPVGMIMLEEAASNTLKQLAGFKCNKRFHVPSEQGQSWDFEELRTALCSFKDKVYLLDHVGSKAWSAIKEKIRFMVSVLGVKFIVLDNLTALVASEDDEYKSVNLIMAEMSTLTQELDCTIFFISHLRKTQGKGAETGTEVSLADFKGSGSIIFWSNLLIALERNLQAVNIDERNTSTIRILKDRFSGEGTGTTFKLKYDKETGRMSEIEYNDEDWVNEETET